MPNGNGLPHRPPGPPGVPGPPPWVHPGNEPEETPGPTPEEKAAHRENAWQHKPLLREDQRWKEVCDFLRPQKGACPRRLKPGEEWCKYHV